MRNVRIWFLLFQQIKQKEATQITVRQPVFAWSFSAFSIASFSDFHSLNCFFSSGVEKKANTLGTNLLPEPPYLQVEWLYLFAKKHNCSVATYDVRLLRSGNFGNITKPKYTSEMCFMRCRDSPGIKPYHSKMVMRTLKKTTIGNIFGILKNPR